MGLHVDVLGAEYFFGPLNSQALDDVHVLAAGVVAAARIPFGVLVVHDAGLGLQHRLAGVVLGGDQHDVIALPFILLPDGLRYFRVSLRQVGHPNLLAPFKLGGMAVDNQTVV